MHACVYAYSYACGHVCVCMSSFLHSTSFNLLLVTEEDSLAEPAELANLAKPVCPKDTLFLPLAFLTGKLLCLPCSYVSSGELYSDVHTHMESALATEPSRQPHKQSFLTVTFIIC